MPKNVAFLTPPIRGCFLLDNAREIWSNVVLQHTDTAKEKDNE